MKITTLIGWPDVTPSGSPAGTHTVLSCVVEDGAARLAQAQLFHAAKQLHQFPKGIRCLILTVADANDRPFDLAAHISDEVAQQITDHAKRQRHAVSTAARKLESETKKRAAGVEAQQRLSTAAVAWNAARETLAKAQQAFNGAKGDAQSATKTAVEAAEKAVAESKAEYETAKKAKADLVTPPKPESKK